MAIRHQSVLVLIGALSVIGSARAGQPADAAVGTGLGRSAQFESASVSVPWGDTCLLHPEGDLDPKQSIPVAVDEDGVARFQAVRAASADAVERLALDCIDAGGNAQTYAVDLRSDETFAPRPFDPSRTTLTLRPALAGDPLRFTQEELIEAGYGLRPDPKGNPEGYARWLATAIVPAYKLHSVSSRTLSSPRAAPPLNAGVHTSPSNYWTGPILNGSYKKNATAALTYSYLYNEATFNVPKVTPGGFGTGKTAMTIWTGLDNVFQAIVDVQSTSTTASFGIHHQNFHPWIKEGPAEGDTAGTRFTPKPGDSILAEEWYCDAKGNLNLTGGYACTYMFDNTQGTLWECDQASSSDCESYKLEPADLGNGKLGFQAEFIIEDDTGEVVKNSEEWPEFSPVTMRGSAWVVQGSGVSGDGQAVTTTTDPNVTLLTDATASNPFVRGDGHLNITLPTGGVTWSESQTNVYYWDGDNFNNYSVACAASIAVGPDSRGLTNGTPWTTGCGADSAGNRNVYQMQTAGAWVKMQDDIAKQVAVSPEGNAWAIAANGDVLEWNGSKFVANPTGGCATSMGVGPNSRGLTKGTPWITGCSANSAGNRDIYQMQTGGAWVKMQADIAKQVVVSPEGNAWAIAANGDILYWNGSKFVANATGGCATSMGVGPNSRGLSNGTPWITGCSTNSAGNRDIYQMQTGGAWVKMQGGVGTDIATSPAGNAWVISALAK
jgi:hypothetical protein